MSVRKRLVHPPDEETCAEEIDKNHQQRSQKHFKHRNKKLKIDFVLAAKNVCQAQMSDKDKENLKRRKIFFSNLKKKHLIISKRHISHVSQRF